VKIYTFVAEKLWRASRQINPPVNSYITDDPTALIASFELCRREIGV